MSSESKRNQIRSAKEISVHEAAGAIFNLLIGQDGPSAAAAQCAVEVADGFSFYPPQAQDAREALRREIEGELGELATAARRELLEALRNGDRREGMVWEKRVLTAMNLRAYIEKQVPADLKRYDETKAKAKTENPEKTAQGETIQ